MKTKKEYIKKNQEKPSNKDDKEKPKCTTKNGRI